MNQHILSKKNFESTVKRFRIVQKHERFARLYKEIKSFSLYLGEIIKVEYFIENSDDQVKYFFVANDFNYHKEEKNSFDEYFMYGDFFDRFIANGSLKEIKTAKKVDHVISCHINSYGVIK